MNSSTVFRRFQAFRQAVVAQHVSHAQPVIRKYALTSFCLGLAMTLEVPPRAHRFFITPERKRQVLSLRRQALEALDRYESVHLLQIHFQCGRKVEILLRPAFGRPEFKDHGNHVGLLSCWRICGTNLETRSSSGME